MVDLLHKYTSLAPHTIYMMAQSSRKRPSESSLKRKEHAAKVLNKSEERSEFICRPKFRNTLPSVPCGPFVKAIQLPHSSADFASYSMSTLEKSFIWQPHQLGLNIDLVDQESLLDQISDRPSAVHPADAKYIAGKSQRTIPEHIPWLKRTTYVTNDLYDNVNKFKDNEDLVVSSSHSCF
jgi:hypothetical protein